MKSLIVDDDFTCSYIYQTQLSKYGKCDVFPNGMDAIEAYKTSLNKENPYNLMVIDIMMPDMNGYDVLKKIREVEAERHIYFPFCAKIILTTGLDDDENRKIKQLLDADNEAYIPKSSYPETLIDKLNEFGFVLDLV